MTPVANQKAITVFCSIESHLPPSYYTLAADLGAALARANYRIVYGGANKGLMGTLADAALKEGGHVTGVFPSVEILQAEKHAGLSVMTLVDTMHERKAIMNAHADAFVVLPGGYGTLDEIFDILVQRKLKLHEKPMYFVNHEGFWQHLVDMLTEFVGHGVMKPEHLTFFHSVPNVPELMKLLGK